LQFSVLGVDGAGAAVLLYEGVRVSEVVLRHALFNNAQLLSLLRCSSQC
jgi:hypothetical protein